MFRFSADTMLVIFSVPPAQDSCMPVDVGVSFMPLEQFSLFLEELQQMSEYLYIYIYIICFKGKVLTY